MTGGDSPMATNDQAPIGFLGLRSQPFSATADPAFLYATRTHKECLFRLWNSIDEQHGIAVVVGHYGTGKTTLLRKILTEMWSNRERYNTAVIGSPVPSWTTFALLESIVTQFGLKPDERSFTAHIEALNRYLLVNRNRVNTLIIDDAQNLNKRGQLELLRLVQNLETQQRKLLNLVFFAQLEWLPILKAAPNFAQRVNMTYNLSHLDIEDTRLLIDFRMRLAGATGVEEFFEESALKLIYAYSEGIPRVIVTICRNSLLLASRIGKRPIGQDVVLHTIEKTMLPDEEKRARIAVLLANRSRPNLPVEHVETAPADGDGHALGLSRLPTSNELKANDMLLRAIRPST